MSEQVIQLRAHDEGGVKLSITRYCGPGSSDDRIRFCLMVGSDARHVLDRKTWTLLKRYVDDSIECWDCDRERQELREELAQRDRTILELRKTISLYKGGVR